MGIMLGDMWMGTSYVRFAGLEYHNDDPFTNTTVILQYGQISGSNRLFSALIAIQNLNVQIACQAPVSSFALLDSYTFTDIHTTVMGDCSAQVEEATLVGSGALLEIKTIKSSPPSYARQRR